MEHLEEKKYVSYWFCEIVNTKIVILYWQFRNI